MPAACVQVGFLQDWRRANVALSRARTALVVGHKNTLKSDKIWGAFLKHAQERDCVLQLQHLHHILGSAKKH
jgi:superfamily I DNA and/or RNA helicase